VSARSALHSGIARLVPCASTLLCANAWAVPAEGGSGAGDTPREEIAAWLDSHQIEADVAQAEDPAEGLPPPPRSHGFLIESGIGALGHLGELRHVSPLSPRYYLRAGYELAPWVLFFAEGDVTFSNTSYAPQPPEPRSYALFGFGAGARLTLPLLDWLGAYLQGSAGLARVSEDVLATYGYSNAMTLSGYFGGLLGLQAYLPSPHLRLLLEGGIRSYPYSLDRDASQVTPLAWVAGPAIGYAF
jgi:hypothetical protein